MTAQDLSLAPAFDAGPRQRRLAGAELGQPDRGVLVALVVVSTLLAAVFYRFTLLLVVDGPGGVVASLALSVAVHAALAVRTLARRRPAARR